MAAMKLSAQQTCHATCSVEALSNIRKLLRLNGRLLLTEFFSSSKWMNTVLGVLPWWWGGERAGQINEPYADSKHWQIALRNAGLVVPSTLADSENDSLQRNNSMVLKAIDHQDTDDLPSSGTITLLETTMSDTSSSLVTLLEAAGYKVNRRALGDEVPIHEDVIAVMDMDQGQSFFDNLDLVRHQALKKLVETVSTSGARLFWVTRLCQMACEDPSVAQVLGTARALRSELSVSCATCEVDDFEASADRIVDVFRNFQKSCSAADNDDEVDPDFDYSIVDKIVHDVLSANGIVEIPEEGFGLEAAGVVSAVGPEVQGLNVGDRVFFLSRGSFSTSVIIPENLFQKIPPGLSLEDAATMPCVCATAMYALFHIGKLHRGKSVLVHSACGGVGIAAIQLARVAGADIYVTVGNEEKVEYLTETFDVPRDHIFNSRDSSFFGGIAAATQGKGIDLVLNSLSGDLLHATWRCVAEFGTMVEIGKRDLLGSGKLDMSIFLANRSYCCVDLDQICFKRQALCKELLKSVVECYEGGHILPIRPIEVFSASKIREAFRYMQQGLHMGKIVISIRDSADALNINTGNITRKQVARLDDSASYILVGGLGGLGRAVSRWMVEHNARHLVYLSRIAGGRDEDLQFIQELESMGARATIINGSVTSAEEVQKAVQAAPNLKCILQISMVLRDKARDKMPLDEWTQAADPKVKGTWHLHRATENLELDFFPLFSSISGVIGQPGQANYAAANTFLDAFSLYRSSKGLPVAAIDIGAVDDIGVISNNENLRRAMLATGAYMIKEAKLLEAVGAAMIMGHSPLSSANFVLGLASTIPLNSPSNRALWKKDMRMAAGRALLITIRHGEAALKNPETAKKLAYEIGRKLFSLVLRSDDEIQTSISLAELGMNSPIAIEMRSWWRATFGFSISMLELLGMGNLDALGEHAADGLLKAFKGDI
ncbi:KR domain-containing protein [Colletotrichum cereale]|nr:KR domain-containing protein [Colletotrichum cereale]